MKNINYKLILKLGVVFILVLSTLFLCLVFSSSIPNEKIKDNMLVSAQKFTSLKTFSYEEGNKINGVSDNYADSILMNISYNMGKGNPFISSLDTGYYNGEETGLYYGMYMTILENEAPNVDYTRYWHGSGMFVRLFHLFTDIDGMREISFYIIAALVLITLILLIVKKYYYMAAAIAVSLMLVQFNNISLSLEYQSPFAVCFALFPFYLLFEKKYDNSLIYLSLISGIAVAFFDFLTTETITLIMPLIAVLSIRAKEKRLGNTKETILLVIKCILAWGFAYALTFVFKWLAASLVTGGSVFSAALSSVAERFAGDTTVSAPPPATVFSSVISNIAAPFGSVIREDYALALTGAVVFTVLLSGLWAVIKTRTRNKDVSLIIFSLGALVILRYFVLNNHSYIHCFFTYRALVSVIFAALMALWLNTKLFYIKKSKNNRR